MLLEFYGTECSHCIAMKPLVDRLEREERAKVERFEVWHNMENAKKMDEYDKDSSGNTACGGVPFFFNTTTRKFLCGETSYDELKVWAKGEN